MSFYASSDYFLKTFKDTALDKCNDKDSWSNMEKGDNLSTSNKVILYLYRYNAFNSECNELKNGSAHTFMQNLKNLATRTKSMNKTMLFCFNTNYYLSYFLSIILWGIVFSLIYYKIDEDKNI